MIAGVGFSVKIGEGVGINVSYSETGEVVSYSEGDTVGRWDGFDVVGL